MNATRLGLRILCTILATVVGLTACDDSTNSLVNVLSESAEEPFEERVAVDGRLRFVVRGVSGSIDVFGGTEVDSFTIAAVKRVDSFSVADAEEHLDSLRVVVTASPEELRVESRHPDPDSQRDYSVDYDLSVPRSVALDLSNVNGPIAIRFLESALRIGTTNGSITLDIFTIRGTSYDNLDCNRQPHSNGHRYHSD